MKWLIVVSRRGGFPSSRFEAMTKAEAMLQLAAWSDEPEFEVTAWPA